MWPFNRRRSSFPKDIPRSEILNVYRRALQNGVPLSVIEKKVSVLLSRSAVTQHVEAQDHEAKQEKIKKQVPAIVRYGSLVLPAALVMAGLILIGSATLPIAGYYLATFPALQASAVLSPVPQDQVLDVNPMAIAQAQATDGKNVAPTQKDATFAPVIINEELDYTNLSNWFNGTPGLGTLESAVAAETEQTYLIDIPKLKIANAKVVIGGTDLSQSLIQYPGTAMPGELGAPVIFGHSVLRQFYSPSEKNSRRYTSIFSTIMTLKNGDEIFVTHNGQKLRYLVQDKIEVKPEDTYILTQKYDAKSLKLVTCTPEGTYLRRGVVVAQLVGG